MGCISESVNVPFDQKGQLIAEAFSLAPPSQALIKDQGKPLWSMLSDLRPTPAKDVGRSLPLRSTFN